MSLEEANPDHPMTKLAKEDALKFLAVVIWMARRSFPDFTVRITAQELKNFSRAFNQDEQRPVLGFEGARDAIIIRLVDEKTGKMLIVGKGDPNSPNARMQARSMEIRKDAPKLIESLRYIESSKDHTHLPAKLKAAIEALEVLTWEPKD